MPDAYLKQVIIGRRQVPRQIHAVVKQSQDINVRSRRTEHHKVSPRAALSSDMQGPNARLNVVSRFAAQDISSTLQGLNGERNRFSVGAGLALTEGFGRPLQYFNVVLFSLPTEPNRSNLFH